MSGGGEMMKTREKERRVRKEKECRRRKKKKIERKGIAETRTLRNEGSWGSEPKGCAV